MKPVVIVQQFFGLGDIIFCQTIAQDYISEGYRVLWPCKPEWVEGLRRAYPDVEWIDHTLLPLNYENKKMYEKDGFVYLPMRYSEYLMGRPYKDHMKSKYEYLGKEWTRWREHAMPSRDLYEEDLLMAKFGIEVGDDYNFVAMEFGSDRNHKINIDLNNGLKNIELTQIPGFSLFDWCGIIENATNIHAVSSSTLYLFEMLNLKAKVINLYKRSNELNFDYVDFLFTKNYKLHLNAGTE